MLATSVKVPSRSIKPARPAAAPRAIRFNEAWGGPFGVLLVEDNDDDIVITERTLARGGLTDNPRIARDGKSALELLVGARAAQSHAAIGALPDVVLLDLGLPRVSGLDVLRKLKEHPRAADVPIVMLSGADDEGTAQVCMSLGSTMYVVKPLTALDVMNVIVAIQKHWLAIENFRAVHDGYEPTIQQLRAA
jgi:two-component system response regulator